MGCFQNKDAQQDADDDAGNSAAPTGGATEPNGSQVSQPLQQSTDPRIDESVDELLYTEVFHRHGDRTPESVLLTPQANEEYVWIPTLPPEYTLMQWDEKTSQIIYSAPKDEILSWKRINLTLKICNIVNESNNSQKSDATQTVYFRDNKKSLKWFGRLTSIGVSQCQETGQTLRRRYVEKLGFLPPQLPLDPSDPNARVPTILYKADNNCRDVYSAESVLLGIYPMLCNAYEQFPNMPRFPIYINPDESFFNPFYGIPSIKKAADLVAQNENEADGILLSPEYENLRDRIIKMYDSQERVDTSTVGSNHEVRDAYNCRLSHYATNDRIDRSKIDVPLGKRYSDLAFKSGLYTIGKDANTSGAETLRLACGVLLSEMVERLKSDNYSCKLRCVAAHDTTLLGLLIALNRGLSDIVQLSDTFEWPRYAGWMSFEVWRKKSTSEKFVKVIYNDNQITIGGKLDVKMQEVEEFWKDVFLTRNEYLEMVKQ